MSGTEDTPDRPRNANPFCRECGAANYAGATKCYLCGREFTETERAVLPPVRSLGRTPLARQLPPQLPGTTDQRASPSPLAARGPLTYSLSTLFLIVTLACVCFGLIAAAPGLGIPVTVLVIPAMIRTLAETRQQQRLGERPRTEDKIGSFFVSLAVMFAVIVAAGVAFFTACSAIGFGLGTLTRFDSPAFGVVVLLALGSGLFAAVFVTVLILRRTWPRRNGSKKP
jgi:hypothetical protein